MENINYSLIFRVMVRGERLPAAIYGAEPDGVSHVFYQLYDPPFKSYDEDLFNGLEDIAMNGPAIVYYGLAHSKADIIRELSLVAKKNDRVILLTMSSPHVPIMEEIVNIYGHDMGGRILLLIDVEFLSSSDESTESIVSLIRACIALNLDYIILSRTIKELENINISAKMNNVNICDNEVSLDTYVVEEL